MYCINCGKEIVGNIPICGECLQNVLDKYKAEQDVLTRVDLEAQLFNTKEDSEEVVVKEEVKQDSCISQNEDIISSDDVHREMSTMPIRPLYEERHSDGPEAYSGIIFLIIIFILFIIVFVIYVA